MKSRLVDLARIVIIVFALPLGLLTASLPVALAMSVAGACVLVAVLIHRRQSFQTPTVWSLIGLFCGVHAGGIIVFGLALFHKSLSVRGDWRMATLIDISVIVFVTLNGLSLFWSSRKKGLKEARSHNADN